jgi:DNA-binding LacI/PurR family transcriptional regulator
VSDARTPRKAGMRDVARRAGVSIATVSNVLNNPAVVATETRTRVEAAMSELSFVRNGTARWLRGVPSPLVGALTVDVSNLFYAELLRGIEDRLEEAGCVLMSCSTDAVPAREERHLSLLEELSPRGLIVAPVNPRLDAYRRLISRGTPLVLVDHPRDAEDLCAVTTDNVTGGRLVAEHLLGLGHRRIAYLGCRVRVRSLADRRAGFEAALRAAGLDPATAVVDVPVGPSRVVEEAQDVAARLATLPDRPTAVVCFNDTVALGLMRGLNRIGFRIPEDISVVGYDDVAFAAGLAPELTTVRQPSYQLGRMAAELLLDEGRSGHQHSEAVFRPTLMVRDSTAAPA